MQVAKLVPLLIMGGIALHSAGAIRERLSAAFGVKAKADARRQLTAILDAAAMHVASGEDLKLGTPAELQRFIRQVARVKGGQGRSGRGGGDVVADPSLDPWGTPIKGRLGEAGLTLISAGPDGKFRTTDDVIARRDIFNH